MEEEDGKQLIEREKVLQICRERSIRDIEREKEKKIVMGMGFTAKTREDTNHSHSHSSEGLMGFLFIFFPEEDENSINKKTNLSLSSSASSPSSSFKLKAINSILRRSNSTHLLSRAQSTISICALLIFITLLLFTLSTFEPNSSHHHSFLNPKTTHKKFPKLMKTQKLIFPHALQGMGSLYRRGTRAMNDLIVAHVVESVTQIELKLFVRLLYRSGINSRSDVLFLFPSKSSSFENTIVEEHDSFLKLVNGYNKNSEEKKNHTSSFDFTQFLISSKKLNESGEPIWGRKTRTTFSEIESQTESTRLSLGSVLGFDVDELDPENSLSGFLDHIPMNLRRWACYPMLLGRVRRNYKHIMLVDVKEMFVIGDPLGRVKNPSQESVILTTIPAQSNSHNKRNSEKKRVNSAIIMGGAKGVRRLSHAMLTEIVRVSMQQHKKKNSVTESGLINQLVANVFVLKNVNLIMLDESVPELSQLAGFNSKPGGSSLSISKVSMVRRGNSNMAIISSVFKKHLCSFTLDSTAYSDC